MKFGINVKSRVRKQGKGENAEWDVRLDTSHKIQKNAERLSRVKTANSLVQCRLSMSQKLGLVPLQYPKSMTLLFETNKCFSNPENAHISNPYLEILSGEQAEMLVSMLSELSRLKVSKAWSL